MADFDSNPFADPEEINPFADPSVRQVTGGSTGARPATLDNYNPFEEKSSASRTVPTRPPPPTAGSSRPVEPQQYPQSQQPAVMQPTMEPPAYSKQPPPPSISNEELLRRQEELERKAAELQKKEDELRNRTPGKRENNWPPVPGFCPVGPCFYQDIDVDIPLEYRKIIKMGYYLWIFYVGTLLINFLGSLAYLISEGGSDPATTFGVSLVFLLIFTPCSFICWYRPLYKAFRSDSSFNFFVFFFVFFCQMCVCVLLAIGIVGTGSCGWLVAIGLTGQHIGAAILCYIVSILFTITAILDGFILKKVHSLYRSTGASFAKAQQEFTTGVISNESVRNAAGAAVTSAATGGGGRM